MTVRRLGAVAAMLTIASFCGCGQSKTDLSQEQTACPSGAAEIQVQDGFLRRLCGCAESGTDPVVSPSKLTCTVPAGTTVFFFFSGDQQSHQIVASNAPSIASSPLYDPAALVLVTTHAVKLDTPGTYAFVDALNSALSGQIIVQ
jgi:plastocyanin